MKKIFVFIVLLLTITGCNSTKYDSELNVLNWSSYIPDDVIEDFESEYNINVNYGTYSSNEELFAKITSSKEGTYDIVFPSDYMVELMIEKGMLSKMDKTALKNIGNINSQFLNQEYDKSNEYSIPFLLATSVIAYNTNNIKKNITSYNDLLDTSFKNDIVLIDDERIIIGALMQANGYDINDYKDAYIEQVYKTYNKLKPNIKAFDSDSPKSFLMSGEANIGLIWNAEATLAKEQNDAIKIVKPVDGFALSMDNYAILNGSKNKENAYLFIDYLLRDDICKRIVEEYPYISTNKNISNIQDSELSYILTKGSYIKNIGENLKKIDKLWARMK